MTTLTVFRDLLTKYPTWNELSAWLESKEGGSLRIVKSDDAKYSDSYVIVRYDKTKSDMSLPHVGAFRSVVWNTKTNRPVSVAPVKAEKGVPPVDVAVRLVDFVDGTMVNIWSKGIATRTSLGGKSRFYIKKTFGEL